jgi:hypothetical protein
MKLVFNRPQNSPTNDEVSFSIDQLFTGEAPQPTSSSSETGSGSSTAPNPKSTWWMWLIIVILLILIGILAYKVQELKGALDDEDEYAALNNGGKDEYLTTGSQSIAKQEEDFSSGM